MSHPMQMGPHVLRNAVPNVQLNKALRGTCLPVAHGPIDPFHQSVTDILHHRPAATNFSQLAVLSCFKVCCRITRSVYKHSHCHLVVYTACVMPSVDSIRRESHADTQDIFQPPTSQVYLRCEIEFDVTFDIPW